MPQFPTPPEDILTRLIDACRAAGADAADARIGASEGVSVSVREGALETIERDESAAVALRALFGRRQAHVSGSDFTDDGLTALAERCVAMARAAPEDPYCGVPSPAELAPAAAADLDLDGDPEISAEALEAEALEAEAAALAVDKVKTVSGSSAGWSRTWRWAAASNGFASARTGGSSGVGLSAVAEDDAGMERDYDSWSTRFRADRPAPADIGRTAGERAAARLGPKKIPSQTAAVIYDRRVSASLLRTFSGAVSGAAIARGVSFLKDRLGERVFAPGVAIVDDPSRIRGMGSRVHDGEGRPVARTKLIDDGVLTAWMLNGPAARQLGLTPNGFATAGFGDPPGIGPSNLFLAPGEHAPEALMRDVGSGLLVTDMFGPSVNPNTGDYSVGVAGFWFADGEIEHPVSEVTIAGDLPSMFLRLRPANDLEFRGAMDAPSLLVEDMTIAGA